jgi:hypothetical protein
VTIEQANAYERVATIVRQMAVDTSVVRVAVDGVTYALSIEVVAYDGCRECSIDPHSWCSGCGYTFACSSTCGWVGQTRQGFVYQWASHAWDCPRRPNRG